MTERNPVVRRSYRSELRGNRAEQTRQRLLAAAGTEFLAHGYAGTTMRAVATSAELSLAAVELGFRTKSRLLKAVIDAAIAGDGDRAGVLERAWTDQARAAAGDPENFSRVIASVLGPAQARSARLVLAAFEGSLTDPALQEVTEELMSQRNVTAEWLVETVSGHVPLRPGLTKHDAVETLWLLMDPAVFDRLVRHRRWTVEQYQIWFARSVRRLLFADGPGDSSGALSTSMQQPFPPASEEKDSTMTETGDSSGNIDHPEHGQVGYLQLAAVDLAAAARFYRDVFGWSVDAESGSFEAPAMIGQFTTGRPPTTDAGPLVWICVDDLDSTLRAVQTSGGAVVGEPQLDGGERWLIEFDDVCGQRLGIVAPVTG